MSEYMTESEARAVTRWEVGSCLMMVRKTKQVGFEPVFESLHSWSIYYGGWDFILNVGGLVNGYWLVQYIEFSSAAHL